VWKTNKYTKYSFSLLIMYGSSYMFRHYIAIFRDFWDMLNWEAVDRILWTGVLCLVTWGVSRNMIMIMSMKMIMIIEVWTRRLRWSRGSVLAFGTQVSRFEPGRSRRIFQGEKILSMPSFGRSHVATFTTCKRFLQWRGSRHYRQNYLSFLAHSSPFHC
jgi:hypothetical protein